MSASLVAFLLDRSGSMTSCRDATIEAFNAYVGTLKETPDAAIVFTFLQFDSQMGLRLEKVCVNVPIKDAPLLSRDTYQPRGGTPLIDAAVKTIQAVSAAVEARTDNPKVIVCIQTDGQENESREHTWEQLRGMITLKQDEGWQFNFMGAGIDAYQQASKMGLNTAQTMSYDHTHIGTTRSAFAASAMNHAHFVQGMTTNTNYSAQQKMDAGDAYVPQLASDKDKPIPLPDLTR